MPYDFKKELQRVQNYYAQDELQKRFSALITGESGSGKTYLLRTARKPVFIDSFDPGGSKGLRKWISRGEIVVDTRWERDDPLHPTAFDRWEREFNQRYRNGFFDNFGTYCLDSATTWADAAMAKRLKEVNRAGEAPRSNFRSGLPVDAE